MTPAFPRLLICAALAGLLPACAIVDLAAHGMKEYEKSKETRTAEPAAAPPPRVIPAAAPAREAMPEPVPAVVPPREPVSVEPLR
ncbi:hypothetical protein [Magnetospirillum sp. UT-4]|uniref:hypothetical protein n=1 Tax=Magnetospirillum sp. UT-4 TaxID=2681467 RepID=UPI001381F199|nr:hypothetical protein [Magnetospirillum sp. UT-4]CAA7625925.1 exported hypothetical protein [Magnetospirillum sp. UT-4]